MNGGSNSSEQALQDYLDNLLGIDAPVEARPEPIKFVAGSNVASLPSTPRPARPATANARPYAEPIRTLNLRMPLPVVAAPATEAVKPVVPVAPPVVATPAVPVNAEPRDSEPAIDCSAAIDPGADSLTQMCAPADWLGNGRPHWAQQSFECLLFKSGGLTLAAPLVELGSIFPLDADRLATVFGQSSWFMGLLPVQEYNVRAVDTAMVVMPERYRQSMRADYRYLLTLFGSDWGLALDTVVNSVALDPDSVRWRGQRSKRPWLAGTVVDQMCALLDISQLAWMFHNQDRRRHTPAPV